MADSTEFVGLGLLQRDAHAAWRCCSPRTRKRWALQKAF